MNCESFFISRYNHLNHLTRSSTATLRDFQTNSQTAMTHATPIPPISTTNTPPTFASPNSFAVDDDFDVSSCVIETLLKRNVTHTPVFLHPRIMPHKHFVTALTFLEKKNWDIHKENYSSSLDTVNTMGFYF